tara:strand:- start:6139 stop:6504 length:366 start_codon:yes stop_codon:yes gene_type:complete
MNIFSISGGRLVADPETKTVGDTTVTNFTVADNTGFGDNKGVIFVDCCSWGKRGSTIQEHFQKGSRIHVVGELRDGSWTNKEGQKVKNFKMNVTNFGFGDTKAESSPKVDFAEDVPLDVPF